MANQRKRLLLIDGYNVLRSGTRYRELKERGSEAGPNPDYDNDAFNRAREALINDVVAYAGHDFDAVIVFDAAGNTHSEGTSERIAGVRIVFSRAGDSADKIIERMAWDARERGVETLVVTSDASIQNTVFGGGVDRMSANDFSRAVNLYAHESRMDTSPETSVKNTVAERIDFSTRAKLTALRDSLR